MYIEKIIQIHEKRKIYVLHIIVTYILRLQSNALPDLFQIIPYNLEKACKPPELGEKNSHLSFKLNHIG